MFALLFAVASLAEPTEAKVCKFDRVQSPVKADRTIPRISCVARTQERHTATLARVMDFSEQLLTP